MAKKIRFPLDMGNGIEVRTLEELQENFSIEKVLAYYTDGKLITWLRDRYLDDIADAISDLNKDDSDFTLKICNAFGVEYNEEVDMKALEEKNRKLSLLKQYTDKKDFFDVVDDIAFNQDELYDLLDEDKHTIYLCGDKFSIPLSKNNMKYIGINNPIVVINSKEIINFDEKKIGLIDIQYDDEYQAILEKSEGYIIEKLANSGVIDNFCTLKTDGLVKELEKEISFGSCLADRSRYMLYQLYNNVASVRDDITLDVRRQLEKAARNGYKAAAIRFAFDYREDDTKKFMKQICEEDNTVAEKDVFVMYEVGMAHLVEEKYYYKALDYFEEAIEQGCWLAEKQMAYCYEAGQGVDKDFRKANMWHKKVAEKGVTSGYYEMAYNNIFILKDEIDKGKEYLKKVGEDKVFLKNLKVNLRKQIDNLPMVKYYCEYDMEKLKKCPCIYNEPFYFGSGNIDSNTAIRKYIDEYYHSIRRPLIGLLLLKYAEGKMSDIYSDLENHYNCVYSDSRASFWFVGYCKGYIERLCDYAPKSSSEVYSGQFYEERYMMFSKDAHKYTKNKLLDILLDEVRVMVY